MLLLPELSLVSALNIFSFPLHWGRGVVGGKQRCVLFSRLWSCYGCQRQGYSWTAKGCASLGHSRDFPSTKTSSERWYWTLGTHNEANAQTQKAHLPITNLQKAEPCINMTLRCHRGASQCLDQRSKVITLVCVLQFLNI